MDTITELFCAIDDFYQTWGEQRDVASLPAPDVSNAPQRKRAGQMSASELMTIVVSFHQSNYRNFKHYCLNYVHNQLRWAFPKLISYSRFIQLMPRLWLPLTLFLWLHCRGQCTGISFVDSTKVAVCGNKRTSQHRVFDGLAKMGKSSMGWFYGFKLHITINERGELLSFTLTPGNTDDREVLDRLTRGLWGKLFGDKGYISQAWCDKLRKKVSN